MTISQRRALDFRHNLRLPRTDGDNEHKIQSRTLLVISLLAYPLLIIGVVQTTFAALSILLFHDNETLAFLRPGSAAIILASIAITLTYRKTARSHIQYRDAMLYVTLTWIMCSLVGAIPIYQVDHTSYTDAVFETTSALTTTGATILSGLDQKGHTLLMYRQFLQWLGGLGVVIFVVAILPMLNIGGLKVFKAETPGPMKSEKIAPRITQTARYLWYVYGAITVLCAIGYYLAGMNIFDAIGHSFSTVSTGGFSTHDASIGYFNNRWIEGVANIFMLAGAINFGLHLRIYKSWNLSTYFKDEETKIFLLVILAITLLISFNLASASTEGLHWYDYAYNACFHVISFVTSTGFGAGNFTAWPAYSTLLLIIAGYLGGCSGSTAGGNKFIRNIIGFKIFTTQLNRLVHPQGVFRIKYNGNPIDALVRDATMAFLLLSTVISLIITLVLMSTGLDLWSSFSAVAACLNVLGPGFGELGNNFLPVSDFGTWVLSLTMLLGRLEFFTVLVLLSPRFWTR